MKLGKWIEWTWDHPKMSLVIIFGILLVAVVAMAKC